ncbi:DNA repair protein RadA [Rothia kristinae]|uniref:DNA repair protein RadA n=1 Tax=Rothia kristinae TaxID=37923 RepID=UPI000774C41F|nr:DNA repair protein RadA [Rothia kristinae]TDP54529.1 DNA repair protein RadA/Sms [Kocuria sp. AG109]MCA1169825.1 DNA repair protein RadA [Rothia kristinae]MCT1356403.1 DNA repair protein RadA [Rothia kristinae]MCT1393244.1 DNA repair protein RadA [Rothia kristinae]MCT1505242.1 DNA repair protein RadA [Rothia kristinae]
MSPARKSPRAANAYRCRECGWTTAKWVGRCGECQQWGTIEEVGAVASGPRTSAAASVQTPAQPITQVDATLARAASTGIAEFDRVLGGGLVPGAVVLMAGEPGVGKSTLLLDVAATFARGAGSTRDVLYVTGEESAAQVKLRADRIGADADTLYLAAETDLGAALAHIERINPTLLILDSVQTLASAEVDGSAGGVTQVREVAAAVIAEAKRRNMTTLLVGHVTKEGAIAGPRLLEHLVDVVCQFEGDKNSRIRMLRAVKNRFGPTDEVGCFDLLEDGITGVSDPSGLFVSRTPVPVAGTCLSVTLEGRRPLLAEVQALLDESSTSQPRRATAGLDAQRTAMLLAVLQRRAGFGVGKMDCYLSTVGGVRLSEPAADLATVMALASAAEDKPLPRRLVVFGEVGLAGEVRAVPGIRQRIAEAARLGFTHALVPASPAGVGQVPEGFTVKEVASVVEAVATLFPGRTKG